MSAGLHERQRPGYTPSGHPKQMLSIPNPNAIVSAYKQQEALVSPTNGSGRSRRGGSGDTRRRSETNRSDNISNQVRSAAKANLSLDDYEEDIVIVQQPAATTTVVVAEPEPVPLVTPLVQAAVLPVVAATQAAAAITSAVASPIVNSVVPVALSPIAAVSETTTIIMNGSPGCISEPYKTKIPLHWSGKGKSFVTPPSGSETGKPGSEFPVASVFTIHRDAVQKLFRPSVRNIDRAGDDASAYHASKEDYHTIHINRVIARTVQNGFPFEIYIAAITPGMEGAFNDLIIPGHTNKRMIMLPALVNSINGGDNGLEIVDHSYGTQSILLQTLGGASIEQFRGDITYPAESSGDTNVGVRKGSALCIFILDMFDVLNRPEYGLDPQRIGEDATYIYLPPELVLEAIDLYNKKVVPLFKGRVNAAEEWKFALIIPHEAVKTFPEYFSADAKSSVSITLEIEYLFLCRNRSPSTPTLEDPRGSSNRRAMRRLQDTLNNGRRK